MGRVHPPGGGHICFFFFLTNIINQFVKSSPQSHSYVSLPEGMISKHGLVGGLEHDFYDFPFSWGFHHH